MRFDTKRGKKTRGALCVNLRNLDTKVYNIEREARGIVGKNLYLCPYIYTWNLQNNFQSQVVEKAAPSTVQGPFNILEPSRLDSGLVHGALNTRY